MMLGHGAEEVLDMTLPVGRAIVYAHEQERKENLEVQLEVMKALGVVGHLR